jgi:hypothetical protein
MLRKIFFLFIFVSVLFTSRAEEGMIIPSLIKAFESDMQARGMRLSAEDIYSVNNSSLKDAVLHFGGGCTAEIVSNQGLILTNHHCGYYQIQQHSSLENDYLKYGFWAKTKADELPNEGLHVTRIVRIEDVTKAVIQGTEDLQYLAQFEAKVAANIKILVEEVKKTTGYEAEIKAFDYGNSYYMMVKENFPDVRLVGAPPSFIGKFGGDTDNWVWPRHTGDFSMFRVYVGKDNKPAPYSTENIPYKPLHHFPVSLSNRNEGDFTMVYGFPGSTEQHVTSEYLKFIIEKERPARIKMREKSLSVIDAAMRESDASRIQYASKQSRIANAYKKWIGQIDGLQRLDAVQIKKEREAEYTKRANENPEWQKKYGTVVNSLIDLFKIYEEFEMADAVIIEYVFYGPEFLRLARTVESYVSNYSKWEANGEWNDKKTAIVSSLRKHFKDYDAKIDQGIFDRISPVAKELLKEEFQPLSFTEKKLADLSALIYGKSILVNEEKLISFIEKLNEKSAKKFMKDPGYLLYSDFWDVRGSQLAKNIQTYQAELELMNKVYVAGQYEMFPDKNHWADANSTLRVTYGKVEGSAPRDGMRYTHYTTIDGMVEKFNSGNPDFEMDKRMLDLNKAKEYGGYAQDGEMWVCFSGSNHTTGGNSGSPALDGKGNLIGINFDRTWESTMSDFMFDTSRCRNIMVDIRYVLWVIDVYAGAGHLVKEMTLVRE